MNAADQVTAGMDLLGRDVRFAHEPDGPVHRVLAVGSNGMVTLYNMAGEFAPHLFIMAGGPEAACPGLLRDVALLPAVSPDGATAELKTGEILLLPAELWQAIDRALETAAAVDDQVAARTAFAGAFAQALHQAGLLLVKAADPKSTRTVSVQTYSLALEGKHVAEAKLGFVRSLVMGWQSGHGVPGADATLLDELAQGVLANAGRAPPNDRPRLEQAFHRVRALVAVVMGKPTEGWDLSKAPPIPIALAAMFNGVLPSAGPDGAPEGEPSGDGVSA